MPNPLPPPLKLSARQRTILQSIARCRTNPYRMVMRAKIILEIDSGANNDSVARNLKINRETVRHWRATFLSLQTKLERGLRRI